MKTFLVNTPSYASQYITYLCMSLGDIFMIIFINCFMMFMIFLLQSSINVCQLHRPINKMLAKNTIIEFCCSVIFFIPYDIISLQFQKYQAKTNHMRIICICLVNEQDLTIHSISTYHILLGITFRIDYAH